MALSKIKPAQIKSRVAATKGLRDRKRVLFNTANKKTQELFNNRLARADKLRQFRERQSARIRQTNERYTAQTQNVLNKKTLDFLVQHSNIDAPTFTSIFAGFELARASRADRLNASRETEVKRLEAQGKLLEREIELTDKVDVARQKNLEFQLKASNDDLKDLVQLTEEDVESQNKSAQDVVDQEQNLEGIDTRFTNQTTLQNDRQTFQQKEADDKQAFQAGEQDERLGQQASLQSARFANQAAERKAKQEFRLNNPGAFRSGDKPLDTRSFIDGLDVDDATDSGVDNPSFTPTKPIEIDLNAGEPVADTSLEVDPLVLDDQQPLIADVTVNGQDDNAFIGSIFESNEQFAEALATDNANTSTPDIITEVREGNAQIYVNPDTGQVTTVLAGQSPPDGFVLNDQVDEFGGFA